MNFFFCLGFFQNLLSLIKYSSINENMREISCCERFINSHSTFIILHRQIGNFEICIYHTQII